MAQTSGRSERELSVSTVPGNPRVGDQRTVRGPAVDVREPIRGDDLLHGAAVDVDQIDAAGVIRVSVLEPVGSLLRRHVAERAVWA